MSGLSARWAQARQVDEGGGSVNEHPDLAHVTVDDPRVRVGDPRIQVDGNEQTEDDDGE